MTAVAIPSRLAAAIWNRVMGIARSARTRALGAEMAKAAMMIKHAIMALIRRASLYELSMERCVYSPIDRPMACGV
ncbi:hypothetical protein AA0473_1753 [Acetobacter orleanensis NRIC 0473]|nr:hypothetical protein AA0473_1753 [Acetobacter orleanensis NRIC 0473]